MVTYAIVKDSGLRFTTWTGRTVLVVLTSCLPKYTVSGLSKMSRRGGIVVGVAVLAAIGVAPGRR
jgi:hypothetical protein